MDFLIEHQLFTKLEKKILSEKQVFSIISDLIDYLEINDYLTNINFNHTSLVPCYATYNFDKKTIDFYIDTIITRAKMQAVELKVVKHINLYINLIILVNIFHEVNHACQNDLMHSIDNPVTNEFYLQLKALEKHPKMYNKYHDLLSFERDSIATSYDNVIRLLNNYYVDPYIMSVLVSFYEQILLYGYLRTSPIEKVYKAIMDKPFIDNIQLDSFNRMRLGYPIPKEYIKNPNNYLDKIIIKKV